MLTVSIIHADEIREIQGVHLALKCILFRANVGLLSRPYKMQSLVSLEHFREFANTLEDAPITITRENFCDLALLSQEFGYETFNKESQNSSCQRILWFPRGSS
jgi:hypothetical protein